MISFICQLILRQVSFVLPFFFNIVVKGVDVQEKLKFLHKYYLSYMYD